MCVATVSDDGLASAHSVRRHRTKPANPRCELEVHRDEDAPYQGRA